jgi:hypothetical protein
VQSLHALVIAELIDNDGWQLLIELASALGHNQMAVGFLGALAEEDDHLDAVRDWLARLTRAAAGATPPLAPSTPAG